MSETPMPHSPEGRGLAAAFDELLRRPVGTLQHVRANGRLHQTWMLAAGALLAFITYGVVAGSFQGGAQMAIAAWKAPVIVVLSAALCAPSLFVFASLMGASLTLRTLLTVLVGFCAFLSVLLVGLVPIVWLFSASSRSLVFVTWLHVLLWLAVVVLAGRYLRAVLAEAGASGIIVPWLLLFTVVSFQVVTLLRPVLWRSPSEPLLESRTEKLSFFEHLGRTYDFDKPKPPPLPDRTTALSQVLEAERTRAGDTASHGVAGLLRHVADNAVAFTPAPSSARAVWPADSASSPAAPGTKREARTGDVAGSRELAWLMGTAEARDASGGLRLGCFLSVWRQNDSRWQLALDVEVETTTPCGFGRAGFTPADDSIASMQWRESAQASIRDSDQRVARLTTEKGALAGLGSALREDVRLYRPGIAPFSGRNAARAYLAASEPTQFTPFSVVLSDDGTLAYTYGRVERTRDGVTDTAYYVRVWRAWPSGEYAVVIDLETARR